VNILQIYSPVFVYKASVQAFFTPTEYFLH